MPNMRVKAPINSPVSRRLTEQLIARLFFAAFNMTTVTNYLRASIHWQVIITLIIKTGVLAIITAIIATARRMATAIRIKTFSFFFHHPLPLRAMMEQQMCQRPRF